MKSVKFPKVERKPRERIILTLDEWQRIIDRFRDTRYYIPLMIGFYTGLRISETFALTWDDIDFEKRTLSVNKQIVKRNFGADVRKVVEKKGKNFVHHRPAHKSTPLLYVHELHNASCFEPFPTPSSSDHGICDALTDNAR